MMNSKRRAKMKTKLQHFGREELAAQVARRLEDVAPQLIMRCPDCKSNHISIDRYGRCGCKECKLEFTIKEG